MKVLFEGVRCALWDWGWYKDVALGRDSGTIAFASKEVEEDCIAGNHDFAEHADIGHLGSKVWHSVGLDSVVLLWY